jgi:hypothetical protein
MRYLVSQLVFSLYIIGIGFSDPSAFYGPKVKVTLTHTHEVLNGHTHHHDSTGGVHEDGSHNGHDKTSHHKKSVPHSHEVSIAMASGYIISYSSLPSLIAHENTNTPIFIDYNDIPPKDVALSSIFRPPIA